VRLFYDSGMEITSLADVGADEVPTVVVTGGEACPLYFGHAENCEALIDLSFFRLRRSHSSFVYERRGADNKRHQHAAPTVCAQDFHRIDFRQNLIDDAKQLGVINPDEISDFVRVLTMAIALYAIMGWDGGGACVCSMYSTCLCLCLAETPTRRTACRRILPMASCAWMTTVPKSKWKWRACAARPRPRP
jgi:hypothetical protein